MGKRILILQGHPDATARHYCHALAEAYADGARRAGHSVETCEIAQLDFPLLRSKADWDDGPTPDSLKPAQEAILRAEHLVFVFPLWLGGMPALLKGFLEQVARPGFAFVRDGAGTAFTKKGLKGRSARVVVTMGMPAVVYRWFYRAHSVKSLERNILGFVGIAPVHETLIGMVGNFKGDDGQRWLTKLRELGRRGD